MERTGEVMSSNGQAGNAYQVAVLFGILGEDGRLTRLNRPHTVRDFALMYLRHKVREAGFKYNDSGRVAYLRDWMDSENECAHEGEEVTALTDLAEVAAEVAFSLTSSNVHFIDMRKRVQVSADIVGAIFETIRTKLVGSIQTA